MPSLLDLDDALVAMIREARNALAQAFDDADSVPSWDDAGTYPAGIMATAKINHAIGFICGCAAALNVTPLELLWDLDLDWSKPKRLARGRKVS